MSQRTPYISLAHGGREDPQAGPYPFHDLRSRFFRSVYSTFFLRSPPRLIRTRPLPTSLSFARHVSQLKDGVRPLPQVLLLPASQVRRLLHGPHRPRRRRLLWCRRVDPGPQVLHGRPRPELAREARPLVRQPVLHVVRHDLRRRPCRRDLAQARRGQLLRVHRDGEHAADRRRRHLLRLDALPRARGQRGRQVRRRRVGRLREAQALVLPLGLRRHPRRHRRPLRHHLDLPARGHLHRLRLPRPGQGGARRRGRGAEEEPAVRRAGADARGRRRVPAHDVRRRAVRPEREPRPGRLGLRQVAVRVQRARQRAGRRAVSRARAGSRSLEHTRRRCSVGFRVDQNLIFMTLRGVKELVARTETVALRLTGGALLSIQDRLPHWRQYSESLNQDVAR